MVTTPRWSDDPVGGHAPVRPPGPTALRIVLGTQLRRLREARGITAGAAGQVIRASHAKISRMELGRIGFRERDVTDLLNLYGITDEEERETFLTLVRRANVPGWLQTRQVAYTVIQLGHPGESADDIAHRVALRMTRQEVLAQSGAPLLW